MLSPYWGEFLASPAPLELSLNYCSHKCGYCFANLNVPDRKADVGAIMRFLADFHNRSTFVAHLMQQGYPVCISNRVDPFAVSNDEIAIPIFETLESLQHPYVIQTRGGRNALKCLDWMSPTVWYVSFAQSDDKLRKQIEPGAPTIKHRLELIEKAKSLGHDVVVGMNPCIEEWLPNPEPLIKQLASLGVHGCWVEPLHFSSKQVGKLTDRERAAIGEQPIKKALKRNTPPEVLRHHLKTRDLVTKHGMEVFSGGQGIPSGFFDPYKRFPVFPTMQDFVNHCHENVKDDGVLTFGDFRDFMLPKLPQGTWSIGHYFGKTAQNLAKSKQWQNRMTFEDALAIMWDESGVKGNPAAFPCFAHLGDELDDGSFDIIVDDDGHSLISFSREFYDSDVVDIQTIMQGA